ncbi:MAG: hypothetical protein WBQ18_03270 [Solirubrobacteraceae bacterium]
MSPTARCCAAATVLVALLLAACGGGSGHRGPAAVAGSVPARSVRGLWTARRYVRGVVDLSAPRPSGEIVVAARGRLDTLAPTGALTPFAAAYAAPPGLEPYIVLSPGIADSVARCAYDTGAIYALRLAHGDGVTEVTAGGRVRRFAALPSRGLENGITTDGSGRFGHRLLVTAVVAGRTTVFAIDCRGRVQVLTRTAPRVEGGIAVAPMSFGRFGGDLIAPDELTGRIWAIGPDGSATLLARSRLARGQDVGSESEGFVPAGYRDALVADRRTVGNRHPGDDLILGLSHTALRAAGVRAGDLLVVSEGGAQTIAVRCRSSCRVAHIADGPRIAHIEGHVVFSRVL